MSAKQIIEQAKAQKTVDNFMMDHIYPRLSKDKKELIDGYLKKGISVTGAFEFAGVKSVTCLR